MKLYATLENSRGKVVKLSDNESIRISIYEGNKKLSWLSFGVVGNQMHLQFSLFDESWRVSKYHPFFIGVKDSQWEG